jgi:hypothetical protein
MGIDIDKEFVAKIDAMAVELNKLRIENHNLKDTLSIYKEVILWWSKSEYNTIPRAYIQENT